MSADRPIGAEIPGWEPRPAPGKVRLVGRYVALEPLAAEHAEPLFTALCGPDNTDLWTYIPTPPPEDVKEMARWVAARSADPEMLTFAVVPEEDVAQGVLSLINVRPEHGVGEIGWVIYGRAIQGTRVTTESYRLVAGYLFDELGYRRLEWKCDSLNAPSRRAAARLGLVEEGTFAQHVVYKGRNRDTTWFATIDRDWPPLRGSFDAWLDPDNFDGDGRQRSPLSLPSR